MINIYNDDCLNVFKNIPDNSIDCVVTDCPYLISGAGGGSKEPTEADKEREYIKGDNGRLVLKGTKHVSLNGIFADNSVYARNGTLFKHNAIKFEEWLPEVYRVLKEGTHCYIMINARNLAELQTKAEAVGFDFQQLLIWYKNNTTPNKFYLNSYELILMLRKGAAKFINYMGTKNVIQIDNIIGNKKHPTEKPVELMKILIKNSTNENDTVLDCFMGAGSTGLACKQLNRNFIGCEIDERYFKVAQDRLNNEQVQCEFNFDYLEL